MTFTAVFDTELHADCVHYVPSAIDREIAVFSCYELDEKSGKRLGSLKLVEKLENNSVKLIQSVTEIPGVFDFNWFTPHSNLLVTALAEGPPKFFKYENENENENENLSQLEISCDTNDFEMTLSVTGDPECFVTCDNKGTMRQWNLNGGSSLELNQEWSAHDAEIWYLSQDCHNKNIFYSASDDYTMKCWDIRCDSSSFGMVAVNKSVHEAGVCCVSPSPWDDFTLISGSYDEKVRLWDRRAFKAEPLTTIECGSGAWRVVWNPQKSNEISVAAMRAGFHVINLNSQKIIQTENVDDHVAYGIDYHPNSNGLKLASCSFYNNQGQFFSINNEF